MSASGIEKMTKYLADEKNHGKLHDKDGNSLLFQTVRWGSLELTQKLLELGADIESVHISHGCTPLGSQIYLGCWRWCDWVTIVRRLIECGANLNAPTKCGISILNMIMWRADPELIKAVYCRDDMDINAISSELQHQTPVHYAISKYNVRLTTILLGLGAEINEEILKDLDLDTWLRQSQVIIDATAALKDKYNATINQPAAPGKPGAAFKGNEKMKNDQTFVRRILNPKDPDFQASVDDVLEIIDAERFSYDPFNMGFGIIGEMDVTQITDASLDKEGRIEAEIDLSPEDKETLDFDTMERFDSIQIKVWIEDDRSSILVEGETPYRIGWEIVGDGISLVKYTKGYWPDLPKLVKNPNATEEIITEPTIDTEKARKIERMIYAGQTEELITLLDAEPDLVHARLKAGATMLHLAALLTNVRLVTALLVRGANVSAMMTDGIQPIHLAAGEDWPATPEAVETNCLILIDAGADVNCRTKDGMTPMLYACMFCRAVSMLFVQYGANVFARSGDGRSGEDWLELS